MGSGAWLLLRIAVHQSIARLRTMSKMHACMRARMRSAVATPPPSRPPTLPPTLAPTLLGGTARVPSCICAPFESVRVRARESSLTPRCVFVHAVLWCSRVRACGQVRACVRVLACKCVCAWVCVGPPVARRGPAVFIDRHAGGRVCALRVSPRSGRRRDVGEPYDQRAVGWPTRAHVRDRRRRRYLRHRRQQRRHPLQRCPGEHRRRCATGLVRVVVGGYWGYSGCSWGTRVYQGGCGVLEG
jgi:hypothetical protein